MSELTEEHARDRLAALVGAARVLRDGITSLSGDARDRGWDRLSQYLEIDADSMAPVVGNLAHTLECCENSEMDFDPPQHLAP